MTREEAVKALKMEIQCCKIAGNHEQVPALEMGLHAIEGGYVRKSDVLEILFDCIDMIDEDDCPYVRYEIAKIRIMQMSEYPEGQK